MDVIPISTTFNPPSPKLIQKMLFVMVNSQTYALYSWHPSAGHTQVLRTGRV